MNYAFKPDVFASARGCSIVVIASFKFQGPKCTRTMNPVGRHCEEAKPTRQSMVVKPWIATALTGLAMTKMGGSWIGAGATKQSMDFKGWIATPLRGSR